MLSAAASAGESDDQYAVSASHYRQRRWQLAVDEFAIFLREYPQHPKVLRAIFFSAEAHVQLQQYDEARVKFQRFIAQESDHPFHRQALLRVGECSYLLGRHAEAKVELANFRQLFPDDPLNEFAVLYLGEIALAEGDIDAAESLFSAALKQFPEGRMRDDCQFHLARIWEEQGQFERASEIFEQLSANDKAPLADDSQFHLASCLYSQHDYAAAIESFDKFANRFPESPLLDKAQLSKGWALFHLQRYDEAVTTFDEIADSDQVGLSAQYWLGLSHKAQEHWDEASAILSRAAAGAGTDQRKAAIHFHAGEAQLHAGHLEAALEQFQKVDSSGPLGEWSDDALLGQLRALSKLNDTARVRNMAAAFAKKFPNSDLLEEVDRTHARALLAEGRHAEAIGILERLTENSSDDAATDEDRYLLALAYQRADRHDDAVKTVDRAGAIEKEALGAQSLWIKASSLMSENRFDAAVGPLEEYLATSPNDMATAATLGRLAICYARTGKMSQAHEAYDLIAAQGLEQSVTLPTTRHMAEATFAAGEYDWAMQLFETLSAAGNPRDELVAGASGKAWCLFKTGKLEPAAAGFGDVLTRYSGHPLAAEAALVRGRILEQLKRVDPALAMYQRVIDEHPQSSSMPSALLASARLHDRLQQLRQATANYERLVSDFPQFAERDAALFEWAWVLFDLDQPKDAVRAFERLRQEHPQSAFVADATFRLAKEALLTKDISRAGALVEELIAVEKGADLLSRAIYLRGEIAAAQQQWDDVIVSMRRVAKEYPERRLRLPAEYWIAEAHFRQQKYVEAGVLFDEVSRMAEGRNDAWRANVALRRAQCLAHQQDWLRAADIAAEMATNFPAFPLQYEADYVLGRSFAARGDFDEARAAYRRVIRSPAGAKTETAAIAQWMVGETYFHQKDYKAALREYLRLEILYPYPTWQAGALLQAGKCYERLGQATEARELYSRVVQSYSNTTFSDRAAKRLGSVPAGSAGKRL